MGKSSGASDLRALSLARLDNESAKMQLISRGWMFQGVDLLVYATPIGPLLTRRGLEISLGVEV
ncbi:MAG: hypothetical protein C0406_10675 [Sideroxydans sp.]|nr:hypothetical protein [Sideroxydans sp.]